MMPCRLLTMLNNIIPARYRRWVYLAFSTLFAVEAVWDVVDDGVEGRIVATLAALGFVVARGNTSTAISSDA